MTELKAIHAARKLVQQSLIINALRLDANIGVYDHEQDKKQPISLWLTVQVSAPSQPREDAYHEVVCYDTLVRDIKVVVDSGHINLVETLAERIADKLFENAAIDQLKIRIEKPEAMAHAEGVGIECVFTRAVLSH